MINEFKGMKKTGMFLFQDAFLEALYGKTEHSLYVIHITQAAEILLKARIAQEHPLLIFEKLPEMSQSNKSEDALNFHYLIQKGRTFSYSKLPDRLWATTGIKIEKKSLEFYNNFGQIRNQLIHFSHTNKSQSELQELTLNYSIEVLNPLIEEFWNVSIVEFIIKNPKYHREIINGEFELKICKFFTINEWWREKLGEESKQAFKERIEEEKEMQSYPTEGDYEKEYEEAMKYEALEFERCKALYGVTSIEDYNYFQLSKIYGFDYREYEKKEFNWKKFLNNFFD